MKPESIGTLSQGIRAMAATRFLLWMHLHDSELSINRHSIRAACEGDKFGDPTAVGRKILRTHDRRLKERW